MNKMTTLVLALLMVLSMIAGTAAGNGSITINNAEDGHTYTIYKMFDLQSYNAQAGTYSYTITAAWREFVETGFGKDFFELSTTGNYVTEKGSISSENVTKLAKEALAYAEEKSIAPVATLPQGNSYTASSLDLGYYLVDSSLGTLCGLTTTNPNATVNEKNAVPTITKKVLEDANRNEKADEGEVWGESNTAGIGDSVLYTTTINAKKGAAGYKLHDQMTKGLTFTAGSIVVKVGNSALTEGTDYTVAYNVACTADDHNTTTAPTDCDFVITFTKSYLDEISSDMEILVTYEATVNENATTALPEENATMLQYGNNAFTNWAITKTRNYAFEVVKVDKDGNALSGAQFELYDAKTGGNMIPLVKTATGMYRVATDAEAAAENFDSAVIEIGDAYISGLDNVKYYLDEIKAPNGYNKLSDRVTIDLTNGSLLSNDEKEVKVINRAGTLLPATGGMGTTLFYLLGGIMVVLAFVLLVTKKRVENKA